MSTHVDDPGTGEGYDESAGGLDLTPRTSAPPPARRRRKQRPVALYVVLALIVVAVGWVVLQGLGNATLYFRNVDEAVAGREELGDRRFRLQGLVGDDVATDGDAVTFTLEFNGVTLPVRHTGAPRELFGPGQSVVLEGRFVEGSDVFASDYMLVRHDEDYTEDNPDRIADASDGDEDPRP